MPRHVFTSVADLGAAVGTSLGPTAWVEVTQGMVDDFADVTGDHQWIHVDVERAEASPYGGTIAHGYLTLSMLPSFASELYRVTAGSARLNYGLEKVRFPAVLPVGSKVRGSATIKEVRHVAAGTQLFISWIVEAKEASRPVCVAESITLVIP